MPYVKQGDRTRLENSDPRNSGELSYELTHVLHNYLAQRELNWNDAIAHVFAALAGAKLAFELEVAIPYEKRKLAQNGAIFGDIFNGRTEVAETRPNA